MTARDPGSPRYGPRDEITIQHWREAHVDPEMVRAWCRDTNRDVPKGAPSDKLRAEYLAERADEIPLPGGRTRAEAYAALPLLVRSYTVWLGPFQVTYGPCPTTGCSRPTSALPGQPLPPCLYCASPAGRP